MFYIDSDKNILFGKAEKLKGSLSFKTESELQALADNEQWTRQDLEAIWNSFAGVAPFGELRPVKKFRNRPYGVKQIWNAIQRIAAEPGAPVPQPKAVEPKAKRAHGSPTRPKPPKVESAAGARHAKKRHCVLSLLWRSEGVSVVELMEAMGWQRHSCRGFISTLQSKHGVKVSTEKDEKRGLVYRTAA